MVVRHGAAWGAAGVVVVPVTRYTAGGSVRV
jgi:hypothetical protein